MQRCASAFTYPMTYEFPAQESPFQVYHDADNTVSATASPPIDMNRQQCIIRSVHPAYTSNDAILQAAAPEEMQCIISS